jgi:hypothetical protein
LYEKSGLGGEIKFYIFDYPPDMELVVRDHIEFVCKEIEKKRPELVLEHIHLFQFLVEYLDGIKILERSFEIQREKGDKKLLNALKGSLSPDKLARVFAEKALSRNPDVILVSGVGSAYPLLRSHSLLNNLHPLIENTPLILFFPGVYDGQGLRLFGRLPETNYYRALKLVS